MRIIQSPVVSAIDGALSAMIGSISVEESAPPLFYPTDLFLPGDIGGFWCPNKIDTLFQDTAGLVPVAANNDIAQFISNQYNDLYLGALVRVVATYPARLIYNEGTLLWDGADADWGYYTTNILAQVPNMSSGTLVSCSILEKNTDNIGNQASVDINLSTSVGNSSTTFQLITQLDMSTSNASLNKVGLVSGFAGSPLSDIPDLPEPGVPFVMGARRNLTDVRAFVSDTEIVVPFVSTAVTNRNMFNTMRSTVFANNTKTWLGTFTVNRELSDTELTNLKQWFLDYARPFNPDDLFDVPGSLGGVIDCTDESLLYQDLEAQIPVTALGQDVYAIRSRTNPNFVFTNEAATLIGTYALDGSGFPCIKADPVEAGKQWAYYTREATSIISEYTVVLSANGSYSTPDQSIGTGFGLYDGTSVYDYFGVYSNAAADGEELHILQGGANDSAQIEGDLNGEVYAMSCRVKNNEQDYQVSLAVVLDTALAQPVFDPPGRVNLWIGGGDYWYAGVFINRYLTDLENANTQKWCAAQGGKTLT